MYSFQGVTLDRKQGEYIITVDGDVVETDLAPHQLRNPILAGNRFINEISAKLRKNIKSYMQSTGGNAIMGCTVALTCTECRKAGLNRSEANCLFNDVVTDLEEDTENERKSVH